MDEDLLWSAAGGATGAYTMAASKVTSKVRIAGTPQLRTLPCLGRLALDVDAATHAFLLSHWACVCVCVRTRVQAAKSIKRAHRANQFGTQALGAMLGALSFFSAGCAHSLDTPIRRAYVQPLPGATHDTKKSVSVSTVCIVGVQLLIVIH